MWLFTLILAFAFTATGIRMELRGSSDCATRLPLCLDPELVIRTGSGVGANNESGIPLNVQGGWGNCKSTEKEVNSAWFTMQATKSGPIEFVLITDTDADLDFLLWGPFDAPEEGCGSALSYSKNISCGWMRGPTVPYYDSLTPYSLEKAVIPNAIAGKYYILLVNDQKGNTTFHMENRTVNSSGAFNCSFMTDVWNFTINGTGNATAYGAMPLVGNRVNITFYGLFLDSMPFHDMVKAVLPTDSCNATGIGADRMGSDLGPGDQTGLGSTQWAVTFLIGGVYKLCYKPYTYAWKELQPLFEVADIRTKPPVRQPGAIPDAPDTDNDQWFDFEPKTAVRHGPVEFTLYGFKVSANDNIQVKAVVESCQEAFPSVPGMVPQELSIHNTVVFSLPLPGRYRLCLKHRAVWEVSTHYVEVTTPDNNAAFYGYWSCEQLLTNMPSYCGCFFDNNVNGTFMDPTQFPNVRYPAPVQLPISFPVDRMLRASDFPPVNQGCCAHNTPERRKILHPTKLWGICSEPTPVPQPNQCF